MKSQCSWYKVVCLGPDPYANHFTQADSIIPGAGNPQAWNRYAYVLNNPLKYNDPSGHGADCGIGTGCVKDAPTISQQLAGFGITVNNGTYEQRESILEAAKLTGKKLAETIGDISTEDAFRRSHGNITINIGLGFGPTNGNCETVWNGSGSTISCHVAPSITNIIHEFAHGFDSYYRNTADPGALFAGNYFDITELPRNGNGYKCVNSPCLEHSWLAFKNDPGFEGRPQDNFLEEFADMYMNWVLDGNQDYPQNGFTTDLAGEARRQDMNRHMQDTWLRNLGLIQ